MKDNLLPSNHLAKLRIKEPVGWFVAGEGFRCAIGLLSDGAFKLFAHLSLQAHRWTGRMTATHKELAAALGKSKRVVGTYVAELESKEVCKVLSGKKRGSQDRENNICWAPHCSCGFCGFFGPYLVRSQQTAYAAIPFSTCALTYNVL